VLVSPTPQRKELEMRNSRNVIAALVLALVLSTPTFAGIMVAEIASPTPTPTPTADGIMVAEVTDDGTQTGAATPNSDTANTVTEIALNLLQSVLSLV
jgi:hypothetical protein